MALEFRDVERDLQLDQDERDSRFRIEHDLIPVVLCNQEGQTEDANGNATDAKVPSNDDYVFARAFGDSIPSQYLNLRGVPPFGGMPCWAGYASDSLEIEILGLNAANTVINRQQLNNRHAREHEPGGYDLLNVYLRMLVPLRATPISGLTLQVAPLVYDQAGTLTIYNGTNTLDLTSNVPTSGLARYTLIYLDTGTNAIATLDGNTVADSPTILPVLPTPPNNSIPSAWVRLAGGQTLINETNDMIDARIILSRFMHQVTAGKGSNLTIASGAITVTDNYHLIDTEGAAASDDLDTINGGSLGDILVLRAVDSARTVVCKDGTGNLILAGDMSLDNTEDTITLINDTSWYELSRSDNGA